MTPRVTFVGSVRCLLGESPLWDPDVARLFLADARAPAVLRVEPGSGEVMTWRAPAAVGSVGLGEPGALVVGVGAGLSRLDLATGAYTPAAAVELAPGERMNDGKTDPAGRYVTGTLTAHGVEPPVGRLLRFEAGRPVEVLERGVAISNAIAFSPAGDRMYFADSLELKIWSYPYDPASGAAGARRLFADTRELGSAPDGATVDADGRLWVALVQADRIACFSPDGELERTVPTPAPFPSCPAFGGAGLDVLYVTSIADSGGRLVSDHADAGRLMAIEGLGVRGLPEPRCRL